MSAGVRARVCGAHRRGRAPPLRARPRRRPRASRIPTLARTRHARDRHVLQTDTRCYKINNKTVASPQKLSGYFPGALSV